MSTGISRLFHQKRHANVQRSGIKNRFSFGVSQGTLAKIDSELKPVGIAAVAGERDHDEVVAHAGVLLCDGIYAYAAAPRPRRSRQGKISRALIDQLVRTQRGKSPGGHARVVNAEELWSPFPVSRQDRAGIEVAFWISGLKEAHHEVHASR